MTNEELEAKVHYETCAIMNDLVSPNNCDCKAQADRQILCDRLDAAQRLCAECGRGFMDTDWAMERQELEAALAAKTEALREVGQLFSARTNVPVEVIVTHALRIISSALTPAPSASQEDE